MDSAGRLIAHPDISQVLQKTDLTGLPQVRAAAAIESDRPPDSVDALIGRNLQGREVLTGFRLYGEMHRFIPVYAHSVGAKIIEVRVNHHPRQFGRTKYGLERTFKVLLDLMVVKVVASFTARPMLWFVRLAIPLAILGTIALTVAIWEFSPDQGTLSLPKAGTGIVLLMGAILVVCGGVLGEVIYRLGDLRPRDFSRLTDTVWGPKSGASPAEKPSHD